jgi:hypothetical protein
MALAWPNNFDASGEIEKAIGFRRPCTTTVNFGTLAIITSVPNGALRTLKVKQLLV